MTSRRCSTAPKSAATPLPIAAATSCCGSTSPPSATPWRRWSGTSGTTATSSSPTRWKRTRSCSPEPARQRICSQPTINDQLNALFLHAARRGIPLYVLIDEYDNFANTILAHRGADAYHAVTHGGGFYRSFFATLKTGTENGSVERLFVTGVSPVTMDDVTSGFNIGSNLSLQPEFSEMLGFSEDEVRRLVDTYRNLGVFDQDVTAAMDTMREWYDGYRFAKAADNVVYNTDMVLYYLKHSVPNKSGPDNLIDDNVHIDYGKLRHLLTVGRRLNGSFDLLRHVIAEGRADSCRLSD